MRRNYSQMRQRVAHAIALEMLRKDGHWPAVKETVRDLLKGSGNGRPYEDPCVLRQPGRTTGYLLIHEYGHHYCNDHLSKEFYRALTKLGTDDRVSLEEA